MMPGESPFAVSSREDDQACREMIRGGSRSFFAASLLLPARFRRDAFALYAFCREADDAVDEAHADEDAPARLTARLDAIYAGRPQDRAADRAFARVVHAHDLPRAWPEALIEGFVWDREGRVYETLSELRAYAARVAGTVGVMMAHLMGVRDAARLARACDLGVAMQLTNIARDVGEDARNARLYLPRAWLVEEGVDPDAFLAAPAASPGVRRATARLLAEADRLYARAEEGIRALPIAYRPAMAAARRIYAAIGDAVAARDCDSVTGRARTGAWTKAGLLARALGDAARGGPCDRAAPLGETAFLLREAAIEAEPARAGYPARLLEMWEAIERHDRARRHPALFDSIPAE